MITDGKMVYPSEDAVKISFESKRTSMYIKALLFDKISPETLPENVVFSIDNLFAEQWRKMLH